jgi:hypothetical protein
MDALYFGDLFGAYIRGGLIFGVGLYLGGAYSRRFTVVG